ncbi:MAG: ABC transporter permease [Gammaproteobacteria bacterium]|nr:ABC transporter permease [Gammaproteobacteria bacterium]
MSLWFDLKYAWRLLLDSPGHSLICIVVVALSVGLAVWTWTLVYSQALRPLPFLDSDRWLSVQVAADATARPWPNLDAYTYQELLERNRSARHLGAFTTRAAVLSEGEASISLRAAAISPGLLSAMQVAPRMGRLFEAAESEPDAAPVAILSFDTWQNYFAADPEIVGRLARIDARPVQIVGVMPEDFFAFEYAELWLPLQLKSLARPGDSSTILSAVIALEKGQTADAVANEMKAAVEDVNRNYPELFNAGRHIVLIPAHLMFTYLNLQVVATTSFIAVAVLLLGCVNFSMVFLARLLERSRELALRTALGASRSRLLRQCLLETALFVLLGLLLGYALADLGVRWTHGIAEFAATTQATGDTPDVPTLRPLDLVAALAAATVVWLLSTLLPAWRVARQDAAQVLAGSGKGVAGPGSAKSASLLVGLQVAVSCLVLVVCANLVLSIHEEVSKPTGMSTGRVMISTYPTVFDARYSEAHDRLRYWDRLAAAIKSRMPGTEIAYATVAPSRPSSVPVAIEHQEGAANRGMLTLPLTAVSDTYFELLGVELRSGRLFDSTDDSAALDVAIVDENAARRYWPDQSVLGKRIQLDPAGNGPWLTVVGAVSNVTRLYRRDVGVVYRPLRQAAPAEFHLVAKLPTSAADSRVQLRAAAFAVDRDLPLHNLQMLDDYLAAMNLSFTAMVPLFTVITAITLILAATGLFGLISRSVARRTQEIGVRRALGSTQWQVTAVFLRQGALYLSVGVAGGGLGIVLMNLISASIPNILSRAAPATLGVLLLMALVVFTASYLPTRRATGLEPGDALRYE